ncbi:MAG: VOC family protein [Alphaproteobacteria bacterium]|tara:strand:- start:749 stop:1237 length:489 start_codon:yes stop_codon:yes gene_type:complete
MINLKKLHHNAYRCIDSEETRKFYEDFLGLPLIKAFEISETMTGKKTKVLHTFYSLGDSSSLAFFEILNDKFEYKRWHDFDLHIALEVEESILLDYFKKGKNNNIETRGISNHGFIKSIYFRDPNGYVIELTTPTKNYKNIFKAKPREILNEWTSYKNENFK